MKKSAGGVIVGTGGQPVSVAPDECFVTQHRVCNRRDEAHAKAAVEPRSERFWVCPVTDYATEPVEGSVALTHGPTGTAWQRFFSDGLWHSATGKVSSWKDMLGKQPNLVVVYRAPEEVQD